MDYAGNDRKWCGFHWHIEFRKLHAVVIASIRGPFQMRTALNLWTDKLLSTADEQRLNQFGFELNDNSII